MKLKLKKKYKNKYRKKCINKLKKRYVYIKKFKKWKIKKKYINILKQTINFKYKLPEIKYINLNNNLLKYKKKKESLLTIKKNKLKRKRIEKVLFKWKLRFIRYGKKHFPLIGIRIECNGPTRKGKRTKMVTYDECVKYDKLSGKMPHVTKMADLYYWQTYARVRRAAIGIKIWMYYNTPIYELNKKKKRIDFSIEKW